MCTAGASPSPKDADSASSLARAAAAFFPGARRGRSEPTRCGSWVGGSRLPCCEASLFLPSQVFRRTLLFHWHQCATPGGCFASHGRQGTWLGGTCWTSQILALLSRFSLLPVLPISDLRHARLHFHSDKYLQLGLHCGVRRDKWVRGLWSRRFLWLVARRLEELQKGPWPF